MMKSKIRKGNIVVGTLILSLGISLPCGKAAEAAQYTGGLTYSVINVADAGAEENTEAEKEVVKKYGILIGSKDGKYSWYDLNDTTLKSAIQIQNGCVMLPAWKMASLMPEITYSYKDGKLTLSNKQNGRKLVCTKNSADAVYYSSKNAKGVTKTMKYKLYIAKSGSVMVSADALKWIMNTKNGYKYYNAEAMTGLGYDSVMYSAVLVYHPCGEIKELVKATSVKGIANTVRVTIPEGYSVPQIFHLLVKKGVCKSVEELYDQCENYDYSYRPLIAELIESENRCFRLEGYLYPDTYDFYRLCSPQDAIGRFLKNAEDKITAEMRQRAAELNMSMNEVLTLASIIEKETASTKEMSKISAVFWNRLNIKQRLQSDAPSQYVERYIKPNISGDINRYNSFYNTYKCAALPAGPICNPGHRAIMAALYPDQEITAFYFFSTKEGEYIYSDTFEEHQNRLKEYGVK